RNSVTFRHDADGAVHVTPTQPIAPYPVRLTDRLVHWATAAPERVFIARRNDTGGGRKITYAQALVTARSVATSLLARGLSAERPVAILSGTDRDHAMLALGCLYAGIPYAPVSPSYSTLSSDFAKLRYIVGKLTPGLIFAQDSHS